MKNLVIFLVLFFGSGCTVTFFPVEGEDVVEVRTYRRYDSGVWRVVPSPRYHYRWRRPPPPPREVVAKPPHHTKRSAIEAKKKTPTKKVAPPKKKSSKRTPRRR